MANDQEILSRLFSLNARGIKYDLDRMRSAVLRCGNPQEHAPCFHVAGTNGKGSVCAYLESAIRSCGKRTGLFTSPHLVSFEERFMINGRPIDRTIWLGVFEELRPVIDSLQLTFFEATTLMAFEIFRREKVEWSVFETGMGGRLDATNVVVPVVSVISRIAMDHREYLGNDLASVAREKLGIVKNRVPLVMAEPAEETIRALAVARCSELDTTCVFMGMHEVSNRAADSRGTGFTWDGCLYRVNLRGGYQVNNALIALRALKAAGFRDNVSIAAGLERAAIPGRFQVESLRDRTVIFDVGHNPNAAESFVSALHEKYGGKTVCFVTGIMKDKDIAGILLHYCHAAKRLILSRPATERAATPEELEHQIPGDYKGACMLSKTIPEALEEAFATPEQLICVAGSFFTVGEAMQYLGVKPYRDW